MPRLLAALNILLCLSQASSFITSPTPKHDILVVEPLRKRANSFPGASQTRSVALYSQKKRSSDDTTTDRRKMILSSVASAMLGLTAVPGISYGADDVDAVQVTAGKDAKQLFNEARALESQGNMAAAQRIYAKVTQISPKFIYGWSNLGNTQVALSNLEGGERSYSKAIKLCKESLEVESQFGVRRCDDLYILLLNRGALRMNNNMAAEALADLEASATLRGKPDAIILQNRARAREINGQYAGADSDYDIAISMTSNEVAPFWLRSAMVKFQTGQSIGAMDLVRRVEVRFPEAPEVRAALATLLWAKGDTEKARKKYLEIPNSARKNFVDLDYLQKTIVWPPAMIDSLKSISKAVGDIVEI